MSVGWLRQLLILGAGGFIGAVLRYGLSGLVHKIRASQSLPYGTLTVNVLGCLLIGVLAGMAESRNVLGPDVRLFLFLGLLGGFTTFSTFGFETMTTKPLFEWLVARAREHGLAGATVLRGLEGYGAQSRLHTAKILRLSTDLPVVIEIVDTREKIEAFMPVVDGAVKEGLATIEKVDIRFYRSGGEGDAD